MISNTPFRYYVSVDLPVCGCCTFCSVLLYSTCSALSFFTSFTSSIILLLSPLFLVLPPHPLFSAPFELDKGTTLWARAASWLLLSSFMFCACLMAHHVFHDACRSMLFVSLRQWVVRLYLLCVCAVDFRCLVVSMFIVMWKARNRRWVYDVTIDDVCCCCFCGELCCAVVRYKPVGHS